MYYGKGIIRMMPKTCRYVTLSAQTQRGQVNGYNRRDKDNLSVRHREHELQQSPDPLHHRRAQDLFVDSTEWDPASIRRGGKADQRRPRLPDFTDLGHRAQRQCICFQQRLPCTFTEMKPCLVAIPHRLRTADS